MKNIKVINLGGSASDFSRRTCAMLFILIALGAVGGVLTTTPIEPPLTGPLSTANTARCRDRNAVTKECAPNEACRPTCAQRTPGPCPRNCVVNGCECPPGLILSEKGGKCIKIEECPPAPHACGINEVSTDCYNDCQRTCKNRIIGDDKVCTLACTRTGCVCKPDHLRHDNGTCVPENECSPPECPNGEVYTDCGSACPTTCETRGDTCKVCLAVCVKGCFCAGHTIRAPNGTCVEPKNCPARTCGPNEHFVNCPPTCPPTEKCSNIWSRFDCSNPIDCCTPSCRCKSGFYRNAENKCISTQACINGNGARVIAEEDDGNASADAEAGDSTAEETNDKN